MSISDPIISRATGAQIFVIAIPVYNSLNLKVGFVAATITLNKLTEISNKVSLGKTGYSIIFDSLGTILAHPNQDYIMKKKIEELDEEGFNGFKELANFVKQNGKGIFLIENPQKKKENIQFSTIPFSND